MREPEAIAPMIERSSRSSGQIDILVNNAGATWGAPAEDHPLEAWQSWSTSTSPATFLVTQAVGKRSMIPNR